MSDPKPSKELSPHAEFVVGELKGTVDGQGKQLDKLEGNFENLQITIANQFNELSEAGSGREKTILKAIDDNAITTKTEWQSALKDDQDGREKIAEDKTKKKEQFLAEKKELRNKILVRVVSFLIIAAIGFCAMITWLGFRVYLNNELEMNELKQEIQQTKNERINK